MRTAVVVLLSIAAASVSGCATYLDDLNRAERHYVANEHERALALFRTVERDMDSLSHPDLTRYAYLRGMNNYRLGKAYRPHARHWLAVARSLEREKPGGLRPEWKERLAEALKDLNQDVYGVGVFPDEPVEPGQSASEDQGSGEPTSAEPAEPAAPEPEVETEAESSGSLTIP